jgi:hypothetical protein
MPEKDKEREEKRKGVRTEGGRVEESRIRR